MTHDTLGVFVVKLIGAVGVGTFAVVRVVLAATYGLGDIGAALVTTVSALTGAFFIVRLALRYQKDFTNRYQVELIQERLAHERTQRRNTILVEEFRRLGLPIPESYYRVGAVDPPAPPAAPPETP